MRISYKKSTLFIVPLIIFIVMGNYSFLQFTYSGSRYNIGINIILSYLRFPLTFLPFFLLFLISKETRSRILLFFLKNLDILIFVLLGFLSLINYPFTLNGYIYTTLFAGSILLILLYLFFVSEYKKDVDVFYNISSMLILSHLVLVFLSIISISTYDFTIQSAYQYFTLKFGDVLFFSNPLLVTALAIGYVVVFQRNKFYLGSPFVNKLGVAKLLLLILVFVFIGYLMFISNRRTPLILLGASIPIVLYLSIKNRIFRFFLMLLLPIVLAYFLTLIPQYLEENREKSKLLYRLERIKLEDGNISDASFEIRLVIWKSYLEVFRKYPILGVGQGNIGPAHKGMNKGDDFIADKSPHNTFLGLLVSNGILGSILLAFIMIRNMFLFAYRAKGIVKYYFLLFLSCILIMNFLEFNLYPGQSLFWPTFLILLFPRIYLNKYLIK